MSQNRQFKTRLVYVLQGNYGYGWDDLCTYERGDREACIADRKDYSKNEPNYPHRIIERRIKNN